MVSVSELKILLQIQAVITIMRFGSIFPPSDTIPVDYEELQRAD